MNIGLAQRAKAGEQACGDGHLVVETPPRWLVMLADGTGHGSRAAEASLRAAEYVQEHAHEPLEQILRGCGQALRASRGAAIALLRLDVARREIEFASVGNVELRSDCQHRVAPICSPGVVGRPVRKILRFCYPLSVGDRLVLFSDGLSRRLDVTSVRHLSAQQAADRLLSQYGVRHDDATCVVVDFPSADTSS